MPLNERFKLKFPLFLLQGVGNPIGKGQGDAMPIIHSGKKYLLSQYHTVMQLATLLSRKSTWHINNKAPVKRDWTGSFPPYYFHTTTHTKTRPEPNSTSQTLQLVSTKVEFMVSKHFPVSKIQDATRNPGGMARRNGSLASTLFLVGSLISQLCFSDVSNYLLKNLGKQNIEASRWIP